MKFNWFLISGILPYFKYTPTERTQYSNVWSGMSKCNNQGYLCCFL